MKLVINSNVNYEKPLRKLFLSLRGAGFRDYKNIIVVRGQSESDEEPKKVKISKVVKLGIRDELTLINMRLNNFDYTGYHALNVYKEHPLVSSDWYMYILDTVTVNSLFVSFINSACPDPDELMITMRPHSNICAFGSEVIKNYGNNFGTPLTKDEAIRLEFDSPIEKNVASISRFGRITQMNTRYLVGEADIYGTGHPRKNLYYPDFGLSKWIFWGRTGDILGDVQENKVWTSDEIARFKKENKPESFF
jgi:hypothetical protein